MASPRITEIALEETETPLFKPFVTSQGRAEAAHCVTIRLRLSDGREATGESTPVQYVTGETCQTVIQTAERILPDLIGREAHRYREVWDIVARHAPHEPSARCGFEMAALNAWALATETPLPTLWGAAADSVEGDITIPLLPNPETLIETAWEMGFRVFKIKVGAEDPNDDFERVQSVRRTAPEARIRLDANQAFTPDQALAFVERLLCVGANIEFLEQPVRYDDFAGMASVAERCPIPVFADESLRTPQDALRLAQTPVQGFNCKANKSGIAGVLDIIAIAKAAQRKLMLGCMLETRQSIAVSLALACGSGAFDYIDLDSHLLLNEHGENPFFFQQGGRMGFVTPAEETPTQ